MCVGAGVRATEPKESDSSAFRLHGVQLIGLSLAATITRVRRVPAMHAQRRHPRGADDPHQLRRFLRRLCARVTPE